MEDKAKEELKGSPSRDTFKYKHKKLSKAFYACDLDFVLVAKYPYRIVAFLDYKGRLDKVTFSEAIAYNIIKTLAPVYIIRSKKAEDGPFEVWEFQKANPKPDPPEVDLSLIRQCETWDDLENWEKELRV